MLDHFDLLRTLLKKNDFDAWARNIGPRKLDEPLDTEVFEFRSQLLQGEVLKLHLVLLGPSTRPSVGWLQKVTGYTGSLELINGLGHDRTMTDLYENQCYMEHDVADYEPEIVPLAASPDDQEDLLSGRKNADEVDLLGVVLTCRLYLGIPLCMLGKPVALTFAVTQRQGVQATICPSLRTFDVTTAVDGLSEPCPTSWAAPPLAALCNTARSSAVAGCARRAPYPVVSLEELLSSVAGACESYDVGRPSKATKTRGGVFALELYAAGGDSFQCECRTHSVRSLLRSGECVNLHYNRAVVPLRATHPIRRLGHGRLRRSLPSGTQS